ncbi:Gramicidin S synthase II [Bacteroidales bacterium Barb4]|nr:Gramicidin S synthase II [Bacteroidales bacterium Barb4]
MVKKEWKIEIVLLIINSRSCFVNQYLYVCELFERNVEKHRDAITVVFEDKITYAKLNEKANRYAFYLRKIGIKTNSLVAICLYHSLDMVVAILAILKCGCSIQAR